MKAPRSVRALCGAALALLLPLTGCARRERGDLRGWNVLLVTLDTTRADHVGCYGGRRGVTPVIDALAGAGVRFANAFTPSPLTLPAHASILTGTDPRFHGARDNGRTFLAGDNVTLAEILGTRGYRTGAVIAASVVSSRYGMSQGFEVFDEDLEDLETRFSDYSRRGGKVTDRAMEILRRFRGERFFLWAHYFDPHARYDPPEPYRSRFRDSPYDGEIAYADAMLGRLLRGIEGLGTSARTLVVVTADHGEGLLDPHRESAHGVFLYDETIHVPLLFHAPGAIPAGRVVDAVVRSIDIAPTILDLLGIEPPRAMQGRSLAALLLHGAGEPEPRPALSETLFPLDTYGWSPLRSIRTARLKYIDAPTPELYDLESDPREQRNLAATAPERAARMRERLEHEARRLERGGRGASRLETEPGVREALQALGYLEGGSPPEGAPPPEKDPKDLIEVTNRLIEARTLLVKGRDREALARIDRALEMDPENPAALYMKGEHLLGEGKESEAQRVLERLVRIRPDFPEAHFLLGKTRAKRAEEARASGRSDEAAALEDEAIRSLERAVLQNPHHVQAHTELGYLLSLRGKYEAALAVYREADDLAPDNPEILRNLSFLLNKLSRRDDLLEVLRRLHRIQPTAEVAGTLGRVLLEAGRPREAIPLLEEASRKEPGNPAWREALRKCRAGSPPPPR